MDYGNAFRKVWDSCENIFDLAVCCYDKILLYVENEQNFIAKYMDHPKRDGKGNPNLKNLDIFVERYGKKIVRINVVEMDVVISLI